MKRNSRPPPVLPQRPQLIREARLRFERLLREYVIVSPRGVLLLNASAAAVLRLCDGTRTLPQIVAQLRERFGVDPDHCRRDVTEFLQRLAARGLLARSRQIRRT